MRNGLQPLVLEIMQRFPRNESIYVDGCTLIALLTREAVGGAPREAVVEDEEEEGGETIAPWQTRPLVEFLTATTLEFASSLSYEAICQKTHEVLQCLRSTRHCSDVASESGMYFVDGILERLASSPPSL